jgi:hypothetical protein
MIWNIEDCKDDTGTVAGHPRKFVSDDLLDNAPREWEMATDWESVVRDLTWTFDDNRPRFRHEKWRKCFDEQLANSPFTLTSADPLFSLPLGEGSVKFEIWLSRDDIWKRYRTLSQVTVLEGEKLEVGGKTSPSKPCS